MQYFSNLELMFWGFFFVVIMKRWGEGEQTQEGLNFLSRILSIMFLRPWFCMDDNGILYLFPDSKAVFSWFL